MKGPPRRLRPANVAWAVVLVAIAWGGYVFWASDERRVQRRISALASVLNDTSSGALGMASRTAQLSTYLTDDVTFDPGRGAGVIHGRERLLALASRVPSDAGEFRIDFVDVTVAVSGETASSRLTATLTTRWDPSEAPTVDAREVDIQWRRVDDWRIQRIALIDAIERPEP